MKCGRVGLSSRAPVFQNTDLPNKKCLSVARAGCARVACVSFRFHAGKKPAKKKSLMEGQEKKKSGCVLEKSRVLRLFTKKSSRQVCHFLADDRR